MPKQSFSRVHHVRNVDVQTKFLLKSDLHDCFAFVRKYVHNIMYYHCHAHNLVKQSKHKVCSALQEREFCEVEDKVLTTV